MEKWNVGMECRNCETVWGACEPPDIITEKGTVLNNTEYALEILDYLDSSPTVCSMEYSHPAQRNCHPFVMTSCASNCGNDELASKCEAFQGYVQFLGQEDAYRNVYCALCSNNELVTSADLFPGANIGMFLAARGVSSFSLTLVFDFDPTRGLAVGRHEPIECPQGEKYNYEEGACRKVTCPPGKILDLKTVECIQDISYIKVLLSTGFSGQTENVSTNLQNSEELATDTLSQLLLEESIGNMNFMLNISTTIKDQNVAALYFISCNCDFENYVENNRTASRFELMITNAIQRLFLDEIAQSHVTVSSIEIEYSHQIKWNVTAGKLSHDCVWFLYDRDEVTIGNQSLTVIKTQTTYSQELYNVIDDVVAVCEKDNEIENEEDELDVALGIVTIVCSLLSIICLITRIVLHFFLNSFQSRPGRLQLHLTMALLFMFTWFLIGPFLSNEEQACTAAAILLAYGFLASFTWMNVLALDTWIVFRPSSAFSRADDAEKSLSFHFVCGWGIPLLLVIPSIVTNHVEMDDRFKPHFGDDRCWYTQRYAMLVLFGTPIAFSILLNMILYIHTSINLHRAFTNSTTMIKSQGYHFGVYVRLFALMGITWIFGFISAFTNQIILDFIFVILNGLQGVFLFISVVCNTRVISEIKTHVKTETSTSTSRSKGTRSTSLPLVNISGLVSNKSSQDSLS